MDRKRRRIINTIVTIIVIAICITVIVISFIIRDRVQQEISSGNTGSDPIPTEPSTPPSQPDPPTPSTPDPGEIHEAKFIDLQPVVERWRQTLRPEEKVGIMIYDINNSRTAASYNADRVFNVASVYKLLFAYDGYRQITLGREDPDAIFTSTSDKGELTLSQCLDLIIRESYNGCADKMASDRTRISRVNNLISELDMTNTTNIGLESTAADITKLLRQYWRHTDLSSGAWQQLSDSMLNQPVLESGTNALYDWRQGLPSGFSNDVLVYNKVGWEWNGRSWNIYADAAILDFTKYQHYYTAVVLTKDLSNSNKLSQLGRMIEDAVVMNTEGVIK